MEELRVELLTGGMSNHSLVLTRGSDQWAVRLPLPARIGMTLDPETEARVLTVAANEKLTPEVVAFDAETGVLVTRYLQGAAPLNAKQVQEHTCIDRIAATMRRLHSLPAPAVLRDFRPTKLAYAYIDAASELPGAQHALVGERRRWSAEFIRLAEEYEAAFKPAVLCHNDLVAANFLDDGRLWLVDFEYAVRADPIVDLAGLSGLNGFGPDNTRRLLNAYYGPESVSVSITQFDRVIRLVRLMAFFWVLAHGGNRPTPGTLCRFNGRSAKVAPIFRRPKESPTCRTKLPFWVLESWATPWPDG
ncbi:MAG: choline kinase family protein [Rhodospirillaceae bacterium]|nr:choline kinase family protein [Rhodospirillaceae bacterium]